MFTLWRHNSLMLKGKVALITGGSSGIGYAIAERFLKEGAKVVITGRKRNKCENMCQKLQKVGKENVFFVAGDVSKEADANRMVADTVKKFKRIDILVNNAGIYLEKPADKTSEEEWDRIIDIDLKGVFLCSKAAIPYFRKQKGGVIINISSDAGVFGNLSCAAYCAAKGGVSNLTRAMALDYANENIRVNALCPAVIETPMWERELSMHEDKKAYEKKTISDHPVGRIGKPEEIAFAALMLASDESGFTTGACIPIDGGTTAGY